MSHGTSNQCRQLALAARQAQIQSRTLSEHHRVAILQAMAKLLRHEQQTILEANERDVQAAQEKGLSKAMIDRLTLTPSSLEAMAKAVESIAAAPEVVGEIVEERTLPNGIVLRRQRVPIGVITMIFEGRPNVVVDAIALGIKSGNSMILKGGSEAMHSNRALFGALAPAWTTPCSAQAMQLVEDRASINELITLSGLVDLVIPRGGEGLIRHVVDHARVPVIAHFKGLCHIYIHCDADLAQAINICLNAKTSRPGVCNAMESLLLHRDLSQDFVRQLGNALVDKGVELRSCERLSKLWPKAKKATAEDYHTEYLDMILSAKMVDSLDQAIEHIQVHGTQHTEAILARDPQAIERFLSAIDASCLMVNASTRFNDGGEMGLGAELGISTSKIHAYGPMGAREMTTLRFLLHGQGQCR